MLTEWILVLLVLAPSLMLAFPLDLLARPRLLSSAVTAWALLFLWLLLASSPPGS